MPRLTRMVLVLLLSSIFAATVVQAQAPSTSIRPRHITESAPFEIFDRLLKLLAQPWNKNGCEADPNGRCLKAKNGCELDPNGRCVAAKNGCQVDPDGRCLAAKNGCQVDPSGGLCL